MSNAGPTLCDRLRGLQRGTLAQFSRSDRLDAGLLALAADTGAVLAQLDTEAGAITVPGDRARVLDNNVQAVVVVYSADRQTVYATLSPAAAIRLAG